MSRMDKLMAKTANVRATADISDSEVAAIPHVPKSGQGAYARRQSLEERIAELEKFGGSALRVADISPNPWQPRRIFKEEDIRKLADSIAEVGLIQPIIVRRKSVPSGDTSEANRESGKSVCTTDTFELVAGERRWRAHQMLGAETIKAVVAEATDEEMALMALAENLDREDLTDYETSKAIRRAEGEFKSRKRMAEAIGINRTDLYKYLAFNSLPDFILADLETNPGSLGRYAAEQIVAAVKAHGDKALDALAVAWEKVKAGHLDQSRLADAVITMATKGHTVRTDRDIKKLFVGKEQAGSITRDASHLAIKIKVAALSGEQEERLREFVERLLRR